MSEEILEYPVENEIEEFPVESPNTTESFGRFQPSGAEVAGTALVGVEASTTTVTPRRGASRSQFLLFNLFVTMV